MKDRIHVNLMQLSYPSQGLWARLKLIREARRNQGSVNHITGDINFICYLLKWDRTILSIHDCDFILRTRGLKRFVLFLFWIYIPVRLVRYVTVISKATEKELLKLVNIPNQKLVVIPNPLTLVSHSIPPNRFGISEKPILLQIGTKRNKNIKNLIKAISNLHVRLEIVGKPTDDQREFLERHNIDFKINQNLSNEELINKYQEADILTFISTREGFGLPIIEAQALGCPVITSNISSMPEVSGNAALLVNPYSIESIHQAISRLLEDQDLRKSLVQKGYRNVERFKPEKIAEQYLQLYQKIS